MTNKEKKFFTAPRWTTYQPVKPLNIHVQSTEEDKKTADEFRKFIDAKIKEENTQKK